MTADKRTVTTDALETLGTIITEAEKRDAIHLAVEPAVAAHTLRAGEDVGFIDGGVGVCDKPVGIVDPFLKKAVQKGERFWLVVYPRQITSLRHVWEHPAFNNTSDPVNKTGSPKTDSEVWLQDYADSIDVTYSQLISHADAWVADKKRGGWGDYWVDGGKFEGEYLPGEFWNHYENVTGKNVPEDQRGSFFSCSC